VVDDARPPYQSARDCNRKLVQYAQERQLPFYHWLRRLAAERLALAHRRHVKVATCSVCLERLPKSDTSDGPNALLDRLAASGTSPTGHYRREENRRRVQTVLDTLGESDREVLVLRYRIQAGESVDLKMVARVYPERAALLRRLLAAIEMMTALGSNRTTDAGEQRRIEQECVDGSEVLGDFELVRELGRSGMGIVYEARQLSLGGLRVALKILSAAAALDPRQMRRFQVEAQTAACLDHEHIVPVYSVGHERGVPFYVMRLIEGRPLAQIIREMRRDQVHETSNDENGDGIGPDPMATALADELASGRLAPALMVWARQRRSRLAG
jgi:hypothetical protein